MTTADPQTLNAYAYAYTYANNSPVTSSDPSGLCMADQCGIGYPIGGTGSNGHPKGKMPACESDWDCGANWFKPIDLVTAGAESGLIAGDGRVVGRVGRREAGRSGREEAPAGGPRCSTPSPISTCGLSRSGAGLVPQAPGLGWIFFGTA
ncbi:hypothetical protein [Streptomyces sp. NPDC047024]|uniref:hypothetical protein n=1 Tax=Streptomyces sp. NPDC047024 TaxID=3155476 RepID=UPI003406CBB2